MIKGNPALQEFARELKNVGHFLQACWGRRNLLSDLSEMERFCPEDQPKWTAQAFYRWDCSRMVLVLSKDYENIAKNSG